MSHMITLPLEDSITSSSIYAIVQTRDEGPLPLATAGPPCEVVVLPNVPCVFILSNTCSQDASSAPADGRRPASLSRHASTAPLSPRNFVHRAACPATPASHGSLRPCTALTTSSSVASRGNTRSWVSSSKAITPMAQMSAALLTAAGGCCSRGREGSASASGGL